MNFNITKIEKKIDIKFKDSELIIKSLTHKSRDSNYNNDFDVSIKNVVFNPDFTINILSLNKLLEAGCKLGEKFDSIHFPSGKLFPIVRENNGLFSVSFRLKSEFDFKCS